MTQPQDGGYVPPQHYQQQSVPVRKPLDRMPSILSLLTTLLLVGGALAYFPSQNGEKWMLLGLVMMATGANALIACLVLVYLHDRLLAR